MSLTGLVPGLGIFSEAKDIAEAIAGLLHQLSGNSTPARAAVPSSDDNAADDSSGAGKEARDEAARKAKAKEDNQRFLDQTAARLKDQADDFAKQGHTKSHDVLVDYIDRMKRFPQDDPDYQVAIMRLAIEANEEGQKVYNDVDQKTDDIANKANELGQQGGATGDQDGGDGSGGQDGGDGSGDQDGGDGSGDEKSKGDTSGQGLGDLANGLGQGLGSAGQAAAAPLGSLGSALGGIPGMAAGAAQPQGASPFGADGLSQQPLGPQDGSQFGEELPNGDDDTDEGKPFGEDLPGDDADKGKGDDADKGKGDDKSQNGDQPAAAGGDTSKNGEKAKDDKGKGDDKQVKYNDGSTQTALNAKAAAAVRAVEADSSDDADAATRKGFKDGAGIDVTSDPSTWGTRVGPEAVGTGTVVKIGGKYTTVKSPDGKIYGKGVGADDLSSLTTTDNVEYINPNG